VRVLLLDLPLPQRTIQVLLIDRPRDFTIEEIATELHSIHRNKINRANTIVIREPVEINECPSHNDKTNYG